MSSEQAVSVSPDYLGEDFIQRVKTMPFYKRVYMVKDRYYDCYGQCGTYEVPGVPDGDHPVILIVGCTHCHAEEFTTCRATTQAGERCRRKRVDRHGLCHTHSDWDLFEETEYGFTVQRWKRVRIHDSD